MMIGAPGYLQIKGMVDKRLRNFNLKMYPQANEPIGDDVTYVADTHTPMGMGLYASRDIQTGEIVGRYRAPGEHVSPDEWEGIWEAMAQRDDNIKQDSAVAHAITGKSDQVYMDGGWLPGTDVPKWWRMNHGPNPNARRSVDDGVFEWHAKRPISKDEQITWHYGTVPKEWNRDPNWKAASSIDASNQVVGKRKRKEVRR